MCINICKFVLVEHLNRTLQRDGGTVFLHLKICIKNCGFLAALERDDKHKLYNGIQHYKVVLPAYCFQILFCPSSFMLLKWMHYVQRVTVDAGCRALGSPFFLCSKNVATKSQSSCHHSIENNALFTSLVISSVILL